MLAYTSRSSQSVGSSTLAPTIYSVIVVDPELSVHASEVSLDRLGAQEQLGRRLADCRAVGDEHCDALLLGGQRLGFHAIASSTSGQRGGVELKICAMPAPARSGAQTSRR
jgi:hypothetical protein